MDSTNNCSPCRPFIGRMAFLAAAVAVIWLHAVTPALAQPRFRGEPRLLRAEPGVQAEAIAGKPFGVGVISLQAPIGQRLGDSSDGPLALVERSGRTFYPAFEARQSGQVVRNLLGARRKVTVFFLFTGDAPLDLTLYAPGPIRQTITPHPGNVQQLFAGWWREFSRSDSADPYPQFHNYLTATLSRRLNLPITRGRSLASLTGGFSGQLSLLSGGESTRQAIAEQILLSSGEAEEPLDVDLPQPPPTGEEIAPAGKSVPGDRQPTVEPIALRVPVECLYLRAGSFTNFLWFQHRLDAWGGDVRNLLSEQAVNYGLNDRFQRQIGLKESALAPVVGPAVIADVAIIGTDTFQRDGAAMGILFQARNNLLLAGDLQRQRAEALKANPGATEEKLSIADHQVSLISTPDNNLRSFYVVDGDFHLVSTSRWIVERFLETGAQGKDHPAGQGSLGASAEFRLARANLPLERDDTVFVYLSRSFFRNLMGPRYQVEILRRLRSSVEMELVRLAQLMARSEGRAADTIEELIAADALPAGFGRRADGSRLTLQDGELFDSLRGVRGGFIPIPDMPIGRITKTEAAAYDKSVTDAASAWGELDPVFVGIRRSDSQRPGLEHLTFDIQAAPLGPQRYESLAKWLGPPAEQRLVPVPGNLIDVQASVRGGSLAQTGDHYLFFGMQDSLSADLGGSDRPLIGVLKMVTGQSPLRGYLGAWPQPGLLSVVGATANVPIDAAGYSHLLTGVWRRTFQQFTLLSFHREVLDQVAPQLRFEPSPNPAQLRAHLADLQGTNLAQWVNQQGYKHAYRMSLGNTHVASLLTEQFRVPAEESLKSAENVLDARLIDPLGGKYELAAGQSGAKEWRSNKLTTGVPPSYQFPALSWIRGMDLEGRLDQGQVVLHAEVDMPLDVTVPGQNGNGKPNAVPEPVVPRPAAVRPAPPKPGPVAPLRPARAKEF